MNLESSQHQNLSPRLDSKIGTFKNTSSFDVFLLYNKVIFLLLKSTMSVIICSKSICKYQKCPADI